MKWRSKKKELDELEFAFAALRYRMIDEGLKLELARKKEKRIYEV